MPADNSIYNDPAPGWWDENHFLNILKTGINPARFDFFKQVLERHLLDPNGLRLLDIGCGGGILSEEFARIGCITNGIDLSFSSCRSAQRHAIAGGLGVHYQAASAEALPYPTGFFDVVVCCDVLEHLPNPAAAIRETARVLKPGGFYFFDTINRSLRSYFENILVAQQLPLTRFFPADTHDWRQFITPTELAGWLTGQDLTPLAMSGLGPGVSLPVTAMQIVQLKMGRITPAEFGRRLHFRHGGSLASSYIGYAQRDY
jgi:2-polyprenyl-6-hydroxyphenyl methylase/3-demethylubiquinone-9 3-methyltransferase